MSDVALAPQTVAPRPQLPEALAAIKRLVLDSVRSPHTRRAYDRVLTGFLSWCTCGEGGLHQGNRATLPGQVLSSLPVSSSMPPPDA